MYVCMYVKIRRHQHTRVHAHTGPRRHTNIIIIDVSKIVYNINV